MALNTNNDADLIRRVQGREPGAFGELYSKFQPKVERTLSYKFAELPIEDCLDIYQEIWVKVADKIHTYENKGFTAWLGKITTRITLNYIRHRRRKSPLYHSNCLDSELVLLQLESDENPFEDVLCSEKAQQLEERLDQLSDRQKEIMVLYLQGYSREEIGRVLEIRKSNIGKHLTRSKRKLINPNQEANSETI